MWILFVEAGVALFLIVFIVWWTMFPSKKNPPASPHTRTTEDPAED